ncbi:ABC transporter permease [Leptolyngbya ohadii]|uniref:ABC transporter permease n=1 Tax=Leptolyngbya ohadii TaxID=1962290 RepID=UPI000B59ADBA|nr:ABC transporter permease subunit [Leptolyngbya ohadii]
MNPSRTLVIAANVFREVIRDRVLYLIAFFAVVMLAATMLIPEVAASTENKIIPDVGMGAIGLLSLVIAVFVGTGLINKEIEKRTVFVMIAKPISRAEFIVGKHWGLSAVLGVLVVAMTAIFLAIMTLLRIPVPIASISLAALFQILELSLITAVAILFGVFTSSLLATLLTIAVYLMGHFSRDLVTLSRISTDPNIRRLSEGLYLALPDLSRFNFKNEAVYGMAALPQANELAMSLAYGLLYIAVLLTIATVVFTRREF